MGHDDIREQAEKEKVKAEVEAAHLVLQIELGKRLPELSSLDLAIWSLDKLQALEYILDNITDVSDYVAMKFRLAENSKLF